MAEAYIWRWTGIDGRMLAQTSGCVRQFGVVASLGQPAGRILLQGGSRLANIAAALNPG
jgi:hypothetical protein